MARVRARVRVRVEARVRARVRVRVRVRVRDGAKVRVAGSRLTKPWLGVGTERDSAAIGSRTRYCSFVPGRG